VPDPTEVLGRRILAALNDIALVCGLFDLVGRTQVIAN
jgi:hypothetical protein